MCVVRGNFVKSDVLGVVKNALYAGFMSYGKERHEGEHDAIVDRASFEGARVLLAGAGGGKGLRFRNPEYLLSGILFCARCGSALTRFVCATSARARNSRLKR